MCFFLFSEYYLLSKKNLVLQCENDIFSGYFLMYLNINNL